jgi:hypothetical protein
VAVDLPDEAKRKVELVLLLPGGARDPLHQVEKALSNGLGRADGDEQAVHGASPVTGAARGGTPVFLEWEAVSPDIGA